MHVRLGRFANDDDDYETFERDVDIHIHNYDTWNMDHTLALIIVPMLKQAIEVVRDQLVALVAEVAHEHPDILSVDGFDLNDDQEQLD